MAQRRGDKERRQIRPLEWAPKQCGAKNNNTQSKAESEARRLIHTDGNCGPSLCLAARDRERRSCASAALVKPLVGRSSQSARVKWTGRVGCQLFAACPWHLARGLSCSFLVCVCV